MVLVLIFLLIPFNFCRLVVAMIVCEKQQRGNTVKLRQHSLRVEGVWLTFRYRRTQPTNSEFNPYFGAKHHGGDKDPHARRSARRRGRVCNSSRQQQSVAGPKPRSFRRCPRSVFRPGREMAQSLALVAPPTHSACPKGTDHHLLLYTCSYQSNGSLAKLASEICS